MKIFLITIGMLFSSSYVLAQNLISAEILSTRSISEVNSILSGTGWNTTSMNINSVVSYKIIYNTIDVNGNPTIASGALYVPQGLCDPLPLVSYHHGTQFNRNNVPSNNAYQYIGLLFSGNGYITTMPDYLGMGENQGIHPYVHWESEATASIDLIRAAREFLLDTLMKRDNNQLFLSGYSQGGHATMATHKYITINNLRNEFNVIASAPLSAPIDLSVSQFELIFNANLTYQTSEYFPYAAASYQLVYGNLYNNFNEYYKPPYDLIIEDYLSNGTYSNAQWNSIIPDNLDDFMQDSLINNIQNNLNHPFREAARKNDLNNWVAFEPIRLLFCGMDLVVTPLNSTTTVDMMTALGATDITAFNVNPTGNHETCYIPATRNTLDWFNTLKTPCQTLSSSTSIELPKITFHPNPVKTILTCNSDQINWINIYDLQGRLILKSEGNTIDMSNLLEGIYLVEAINIHTNQVYIQKVQKN